jgi:hypothetical protein
VVLCPPRDLADTDGAWNSGAQTGSGRYFNGLQEARANEQAYDPAARRELRELSENLTGL